MNTLHDISNLLESMTNVGRLADEHTTQALYERIEQLVSENELMASTIRKIYVVTDDKHRHRYRAHMLARDAIRKLGLDECGEETENGGGGDS